MTEEDGTEVQSADATAVVAPSASGQDTAVIADPTAVAAAADPTAVAPATAYPPADYPAAQNPPAQYPAPQNLPAPYPVAQYPAVAYPQVAYPGYAPAPQPVTGNNAVLALILSLLGWGMWFFCPVIGSVGASIAALIVARKAGHEIEASGGWVTGGGFVTTAKVLSWINIALTVLAVVAFIGFFLLLALAAGSADVTPMPDASGFGT